MPSTGGYLVSPRSIALIAACLMLSGVSKSGSPTESEITSRPLALRSRAFCVIAMVAGGLTRERTSARKAMCELAPFGCGEFVERRTYSEAKAARQPRRPRRRTDRTGASDRRRHRAQSCARQRFQWIGCAFAQLFSRRLPAPTRAEVRGWAADRTASLQAWAWPENCQNERLILLSLALVRHLRSIGD